MSIAGVPGAKPGHRPGVELPLTQATHTSWVGPITAANKRGVPVVCSCTAWPWLGVSHQARRLRRQPQGARDNKLFAESGER